MPTIGKEVAVLAGDVSKDACCGLGGDFLWVDTWTSLQNYNHTVVNAIPLRLQWVR